MDLISCNNRKFYQKTRFILPLCFLLSFIIIFALWFFYPNFLRYTDSSNSNLKNENIFIKEHDFTTPWYLNLKSTENLEGVSEKSNKELLGEKYGTYGDTYGSLNTLFTGWAFAGLIISIILQMLELKATRKELIEQKKVMREQKEEYKEQNKILENQHKLIELQFKESKKQNFLNQFYALLDQRQSLLSNLVMPNVNGREVRGNEVIFVYAKKFRDIRKTFNSDKNTSNDMKVMWDDFTFDSYTSYDSQVKSYFKFYRMMFSIIDRTDALEDSEKKYYRNILKNFIGVEEQLILMWLGSFNKQYNSLCCKYGLLDGIYHDKLKSIGLTFYIQDAFGNHSQWKKAFTE